MTSFRSNLNSVSSTFNGLTAAQSRLATCFKNLYQKFLKVKQQIHFKTIDEKFFIPYYQKHQQKRGPHIKWYQRHYKDSPLLKKASGNLRNWTAKLKEAFSKNFQFPQKIDCTRDCPNWEGSEIVGKLLSSTLLSAQSIAPFDNTESAKSLAAATRSTAVGVVNKMTSFLILREEYPEIDTEIRSILIARAQTGATIGDIKEDYRKNTGLRFPVYDNITDFLLCIPGVMAYCDDHGTRIFNVRPTEKNRHIFDLVMGQKAPFDPRESSSCNSVTQNERDSGINSNMAHPIWHTGIFYSQSDHNTNLQGALMSSSFRNQQQQQFQQPLNSVDDNNSRSESDGFVENHGGYYQDNCLYIYNRIYNTENDKQNANKNSDSNYNNMNINQQAIISPNAATQNQIEKNQSDRNGNDLFKRPTGRAVNASHVRTSSPSRSRSSQRNDSFHSSDWEYEAHLLDFPILGDDFILHLARMELKCKFKKQQTILQSGLCVSGQTIKAAIYRIKNLPHNAYANGNIIVNIGSADIIQGKTLIQIEHEFRSLINVLNKRGFRPILTTLAPLANYTHDAGIKTKLERFNEFIKREGQHLLVIDIWALFVNERRQTLFDCYQNEPRQVTGASESYVLWNKIGRQRVLKLIESNLEY